ncbi:MAG: phosphonate ABC transporter ATP-binding protein [Okeania sp. SIO2C9]|uniref:phosphonate ABC transporter ATP-binding protein n=1 Tax=Okeania sp. SIO2C9 TaxID=2607791 RepID=UPI0013C12CAF|nr:phosphonate ABC transporter ATP-binding protein [Okeania sp. SIO2C9]NEQ78118.1 phosphonate ABC transporter ATP-binding protein [Okeania sp. SIO2C9]
MSKNSAIEVKNLDKNFKGKPALQQVNICIEPGEMVGLVGASGSGKSTLLRLINGLEHGDKGTVYIFGTALQTDGVFHPHIRKLRCEIGCIFQQFNLVKRLTVIDNVLVGNLGRMSILNWALLSLLNWALRPFLKKTLRRFLKKKSLFTREQSLFTKEQKIQALAALERVGILEQAYKKAAQLSGGQQQRVAIARCLVQGAKIILADEPIASLDPESARKIMELLCELNRENNITIVTSLHQVQMVRRYFERTIALRNGEVVFDDPTVNLSDRKLDELYGAAAEELILKGHGELV